MHKAGETCLSCLGSGPQGSLRRFCTAPTWRERQSNSLGLPQEVAKAKYPKIQSQEKGAVSLTPWNRPMMQLGGWHKSPRLEEGKEHGAVVCGSSRDHMWGPGPCLSGDLPGNLPGKDGLGEKSKGCWFFLSHPGLWIKICPYYLWMYIFSAIFFLFKKALLCLGGRTHWIGHCQMFT